MGRVASRAAIVAAAGAAIATALLALPSLSRDRSLFEVRPTTVVIPELVESSSSPPPQTLTPQEPTAPNVLPPAPRPTAPGVSGPISAPRTRPPAGTTPASTPPATTPPASTPAGTVQSPTVPPSSAPPRTAAAPTEPPPPPGSRRRPVVYLTFDDGPGDHLPELLALLDKYNVKATFFVLGTSMGAHPKMLRRIVRAGHAIGNHTFDHADLTLLTDDEIRSELTRTSRRAVAQRARHSPTCMRPPGGAHDERTDAIARELGMVPVLWTRDTKDWRNAQTVEGIIAVLDTVRRGSIVLMHDGGDNEARTIEALGIWLAANHDRFTFSTLRRCR